MGCDGGFGLCGFLGSLWSSDSKLASIVVGFLMGVIAGHSTF